MAPIQCALAVGLRVQAVLAAESDGGFDFKKIEFMTTTNVEPEATELNHDREAVQHLKAASAKIKAELSKVIVGQEQVVDQVLAAIFTRSHALLVGVPGLAKTLL